MQSIGCVNTAVDTPAPIPVVGREVSRMCPILSRNNYFTEMCSGSEAGSYLRLIDVCITQLWLESN